MEKVDCIVIGAGVVGLSIGRRLLQLGRNVLVLERNDSFGRETSSRNSEVIHAGMYYPPGSLKATLCVRGNALLYDFCAQRNIPHRRVGKIIVAADDEETAQVEALSKRGLQNGVPGLRMLSAREVTGLEERVKCVAALFSETTGILDTHTLMKCLAEDIETGGGIIAYNCELSAIERTPSGFKITVKEQGQETSTIGCDLLVNAGGLSSDRIAGDAGIELDEAGYRLRLCKGEYFSLASRYRNAFQHLIYPPPEDAGLGVHIVLCLDGRVRLGPNTEYISSIDYSVDPSHMGHFLQAVRRYLPFIEQEDLSPDTAGIRPKLQGPGDPVRDFVIQEEGARGIPGLVNLIGIESPGLTACLAIGEMVGNILGSRGGE